MGYINDDSYVRVDFFKQSGKWYTTISMQWIGYYGDIKDEFKKSIKEFFKDKDYTFEDFDAICLDPYNIHSHPLMIKNGEWRND